jgi:phage/plasmid-associated DNA primase
MSVPSSLLSNLSLRIVNNHPKHSNPAKRKAPTDKNGDPLSKWEQMSADELNQLVNRSSFKLGFGLVLGRQADESFIISLDFDCCGKKVNDSYSGCEYTTQKLREYQDNIDRKDGMYESSTSGNMNVLIDVSECEEIMAFIKKVGVKKFDAMTPSGERSSFEILIQDTHQVIPPTATPCKKTEYYRERHFLNDVPIYKLKNEEFLIEYLREIFENKLKTTTKPTSTMVIQNPDTSAENTTDKWLDLLFNVIGNKQDDAGSYIIDRPDWLKVLCVLISNNYPFEVWDKWSRFCSEDENRALWKTKRRGYNIATLCNLAKKYNNDGYILWLDRYNMFISVDVLIKGERDIATFLTPILKDTIIYDDGWWNTYNNIWSYKKTPPVYEIIKTLQDHITYSEIVLQKKLTQTQEQADRTKIEELLKSYRKFYTDYGRSSSSKHIATYLQETLRNPDFATKLDVLPYKIAYQNGIYDLSTKTFRQGILADDFVSKVLPFDYQLADPADVTKVREEIKKICNYNESHLDYYLSTLGYSLTGDSSIKQEIYNVVGQRASNGKSTIMDALQKILSIYVCKTDKCAFDEKNTTAHKEIATWGGARIVWTNEASANPKNSELLKEIADGTNIKYNKLYDTNRLMEIHFKLFIISNHSFSVKMDRGISRRFRLLQMDSIFSKDDIQDDYEKRIFKADENFGKNLQTIYRSALLELLYDYAYKFSQTKSLMPYPDEWDKGRKEMLEDNDTFKAYFEENFVVGDEEKIAKTVLDEALKADKRRVNIKDELKKLGIPFEYKSQEREKGYKGYYYGFRYVPREGVVDNI